MRIDANTLNCDYHFHPQSTISSLAVELVTAGSLKANSHSLTLEDPLTHCVIDQNILSNSISLEIASTQALSIGNDVNVSMIQCRSGVASDRVRAETILSSIINFSGYLGGQSNDVATGCFGLGDGCVVCGYTTSTNFPTSAGVSQSALAGSQDAF